MIERQEKVIEILEIERINKMKRTKRVRNNKKIIRRIRNRKKKSSDSYYSKRNTFTIFFQAFLSVDKKSKRKKEKVY